MNISKQTVNIVDNVCQIKPRTDWDNTYIPHGINEIILSCSSSHKEWGDLLQFKRNVTKVKITNT